MIRSLILFQIQRKHQWLIVGKYLQRKIKAKLLRKVFLVNTSSVFINSIAGMTIF